MWWSTIGLVDYIILICDFEIDKFDSNKKNSKATYVIFFFIVFLFVLGYLFLSWGYQSSTPKPLSSYF
jgi:hypothetical protein